MFDIQYLIKECLDTRAILYPDIKHEFKQSMKIVTASVNRKWDSWLLIDSTSYNKSSNQYLDKSFFHWLGDYGPFKKIYLKLSW